MKYSKIKIGKKPKRVKLREFKCCPDGPYPLHSLDCPGSKAKRMKKHRHLFNRCSKPICWNFESPCNFDVCGSKMFDYCKCGVKKP